MTTNADEYEIKGKDAEGKGVFADEGFLVKEGSMARREIVPSAQSTVPAVHQRLIAEGVLESNGEHLRFVKDYLFDSPSGAAAAVLGRTANGWKEWKRADGKTLSEVKRVSRDTLAPLFGDEQREQIAEHHRRMIEDGTLPSQQQLENAYALFRERFGPQVLSSVGGEALLTLMHDHGNPDSLVYWLEFKNDDEFRTGLFGGIAGGSALKYRIFKRRESGIWQGRGKSPGQSVDISIEEAIEYARSHRDQLLRGVELLESLPENASDEDYAQLQDGMDELAPDVSRLAWGHKYFSLMCPTKVDDYHSPEIQHFILLKMLQLPPEGHGRYVCAGRFVAAAKELGLSIYGVTAELNALYGERHRYWRIGTKGGSRSGVGESHWEMMRERSCVAVGWKKLGNLNWVEATKASREKLKDHLNAIYPDRAATAVGNDCSQITHFIAGLTEGDIVLAADGATILGIGRVIGPYEFHGDFEFPHQRQVEWLNLDEWKLPVHEGLQSTIREIRKHDENILEAERRIQSNGNSAASPSSPTRSTKQPQRLTGVPGRIKSILDRKGQVILYGPPGTGKTYWAERTANDLAALLAFGQLFESLSEPEKTQIKGDGNGSGLVRMCCFHPAYGYEDFLEGYRPRTLDGQVVFDLRDGVFKKLCRDAAESPQSNFYLIVDEINRGDIPRIFGELLTVLEKDKRTKSILLPLSQESFSVPENVFVIGTMNTADRSISLLDAALRRRFGFVEMMPDSSVFGDASIEQIPLRAWFDALNARIREHVGRDARNLQIGHSYLMSSGNVIKSVAELRRAIRDDVIPLLEEYCYEDYSTLAKILGDQVVDLAKQRIRQDIFEDGKSTQLKEALLLPEISTSSEATFSDASQTSSESDSEDDDGNGTDES